MIVEISRIWMYFSVLLEACQVMTKPTGRENELRWDDESRLLADDAYITRDYKESNDIGYDYDWTSEIESSGAPSYYEAEFLLEESCPSLCTCIVSTIVYCSRQGITSIETNVNTSHTQNNILFGNLPELTTSLHLSYNNLTVLPPNVFQALNGPSISKLENVYLQGNQIKTIDPNAFLNLPNLQSLDLSYNYINRLNQPCLKNTVANTGSDQILCALGTKDEIFTRSLAESLLSLNLNENLINGIPNYSFSYLKNLEVLRLNLNQITWISRKAFYGLHKLKVLQLRGNPLGTKTAARLGEVFQHFVTGEALITDSESLQKDLNKINFLTNGNNAERAKRHLSGGKSLTGQILRTIPLNSLENLDLGETNLRYFPSLIPQSLKRLYLDKNRISIIPEKTLQDLPLLQILQLGGNRIERVKDNAFSDLQSLQILDLSRNNLTKLSANSFNGLTQVWSLRLYGNTHLSKLSRKVFWSLPSLRLLYLQDCNLSTLPPGPWIFRVFSLWLYGNPINCNCQTLLSLLVRLYYPMNPKHPLRLDPYRSIMWDDSDTWQYQRPEKTLCHLPDNFRGFRLQDVRIRDMRCTEVQAYNFELARRIASSRYVNIGNSQQSTEAEEQDVHVIVERDEDGMYANHDDTEQHDSNHDAIESDEKLKKSISEEPSNIETLSNTNSETIEKNDLIRAEWGDLEELAKTKNEMITENLVAEMETTDNLTGILNTESQVGRQWLITLPVSGEDSFEMFETGGQTHEGKLKQSSLAVVNKEESNTATEDKLITPKPFEFASMDELDSNWEAYPQGFAEYKAIDDGIIDINVNGTTEYRKEIEQTMNTSSINRWNELVANSDEVQYYAEYYGISESSGESDYDDDLFDFKLALRIKELAAGGGSMDDVIGNLSDFYNFTGNLEDYDEKALLELNDSLLEYGN